jgi:DNA-binding transcriptional LysR family regulator
MESVSLDILSDSASEQMASGRVRLGVPEGLGAVVIAPALRDFRQQNPKIEIDLIALSGFVSVPKREADMSILLTRPTAGRLRVRKLADYSLRLYAARAYLKSNGPIRARSELSNHTLVGYVDDLIYSSQLRYFDEFLPGRTPDICSPSILAQLEIVASGAGLGILPAFMARGRSELQAVLPEDIIISRAFWLAVHEDVASLTRNRLMIEHLGDLIRDLG